MSISRKILIAMNEGLRVETELLGQLAILATMRGGYNAGQDLIVRRRNSNGVTLDALSDRETVSKVLDLIEAELRAELEKVRQDLSEDGLVDAWPADEARAPE